MLARTEIPRQQGRGFPWAYGFGTLTFCKESGMPNEGMVQTDLAKQLYGPIAGNRWVQLIAGVIAMIVISNYQYAFTLFTPGMRQQFTGCPTPRSP